MPSQVIDGLDAQGNITELKYHWINQHPQVAGRRKIALQRKYLPELLRIWNLVEFYTGYRWRGTSYWRKSPSHQTGRALDIAPDIAPSAKSEYAVFKGSDPVLYKRTKLIRALQRLSRDQNPLKSNVVIAMAIEPDHIHIHVMDREQEQGVDSQRIRVVKWKVRKPIYSDTDERMNLPMLQ